MSLERTTSSVIELTRDAFARANSDDLDAMTAFNAPDCVWDLSRWGLGTHAGLARVRQFLADWIGSFDEYHMELEEIVDVGHGVAYTVNTQTARPRGSRGYLQLQSAGVFVWEDGLAVSATHYRDLAEARVDATRAAAQIAARQAQVLTPAGGTLAGSRPTAPAGSPRDR